MKRSILVVDDEVRYRELYARVLRDAGLEVLEAENAADALDLLSHEPLDMIVSDVRMPGESGLDLLRRVRTEKPELPFLLVTAYADVREAVDALKLGAVDYLAKPVDLDELLAAVRDTLGVSADADPEIPAGSLEGIVAASPAMRSVLRDAYRVAPSDATILLTGESGSGKEVVAQFIHRHSARRDKPMVPVNCAAIAPALLASELFGHERGAFTGAVNKRNGYFREAHEGTLFLDEIGDMPLELQPSLLRATETGRITPVGSDKETLIDCRLIAATNHDLETDVAEGRFRQDLYYRLNVITIDIPPLRQRPEDIPPLARAFLNKDKTEARRLSRAAMQVLVSHPWPGNVRELANAMAHVRLLSQTDVILPEHLPPAVRKAAGKAAPASRNAEPQEAPAQPRTLEQHEIEAVTTALKQTKGNRTHAAQLLGITRRGLIYKLKRLGIE
ncbi:two-component system, NtrC family, response regulator HydG [Desulfomicrobium norvegicum]|uniref:Two-component system, NtrC family, response regulator HydG n=1 Tax=Desulfomicrobium norvegicum (strain DSM 1741 / NCIMB 8310) TaxID=52561 RepID=A0A8G2BZF5_DESNO|nr:sigma-54 dependent transcriptional regulator [Desulfomicrobium norvegicum]SFL24601.1 two-component system, NtrC family, response regulator HydG [Desulfomicrobium norvegicum]